MRPQAGSYVTRVTVGARLRANDNYAYEQENVLSFGKPNLKPRSKPNSLDPIGRFRMVLFFSQKPRYGMLNSPRLRIPDMSFPSEHLTHCALLVDQVKRRPVSITHCTPV